MTEKELSRYYWLKKEIEDIEEQLKEFGFGVGASKIKEVMVNGSLPNSSIQEKYMKIQELYMERRISALEEYLKIKNYIDNVEDLEIKIIMQKRFMQLKNWEQIGNELFQDRTTIAKKLRRYLKVDSNSHNSHNSH